MHALKGGKSGWPILSGKLPSLPPLQCTTHFTLHCNMFITINCTPYIRIYFTLYSKLTEYSKIYYPVRFYQQLKHIWVEPARKGKGQKIGNFTLYVLGSLDHLYIFCFAGNCHLFEAYTGKSNYGI